jgi:uncharacterized membrane protein
MRKERVSITSSRLEGFSDGVIAIIITLMVLEIRIPKIDVRLSSRDALHHLFPIIPQLVAYALSFVMLGVLWVNHHQFFRQCKFIDRPIMWYNLNLLLWMCLIPIPTAFLGTNFQMPLAAVLYGSIMFMCAVSFAFMREYVFRHPEVLIEHISIAHKRKLRLKIRISMALYLISIFASFLSVYISYAIFILVPSMYFMPANIEVEHSDL